MIGQSKSHQLEKPRSLNVYLMGRRITCMTVPAIIDAIYDACIQGTKLTVANYNVHSFNLSMQLPWFYDFLQSAGITHCDGVGILKAIRYMGLDLPLQYRTSYSLLIPKVLECCNQHGFSLFLLGAKPEHLKAAIVRLRQQYPNIEINGHHGYFDLKDIRQNERVIQQINRAKPGVLLVGMGMPIQENWIQMNGSQLDVNVIMPGGAIVDRLAGVVPDCPVFLSNMGLEWLYRLCREPKRLAARYLLGNSAFLFHVALAKAFSYPLKVEWMRPISRSDRTSHNSSFELEQPDPEHLKSYLLRTGLVSQAHVEAVSFELDTSINASARSLT